MYINTTTQNVVSEADIRSGQPNTSFGNPFVPPEGYTFVFPTPQPAFDAVTQGTREIAPELTTIGHWEQRWELVELFATLTEKNAAIASALAAVKVVLVDQIDNAVLAIYDRPMMLSKEYDAREAAATAYKAAGYTGAVPTWLSSFATPAGLTATVAADLILSQALQMRDALDSLGALRMRKYEVQLASTELEARTAHSDIIAKIAVIANNLG